MHLIREGLNSCLMPTCGFDRLPSLRGNNAQPYCQELNPILLFCPFSSTSSPFGPLLHAFFPLQVGWVLRVPR